MTTRDKAPSLFDAAILKPAIVASFVKLDPRTLMKNPVTKRTVKGWNSSAAGIVRDICCNGGNGRRFAFDPHRHARRLRHWQLGAPHFR